MTASDDGTARIWDSASGAKLAGLSLQELISETKMRLPRQLTREQEVNFFLTDERRLRHLHGAAPGAVKLD